MVMIEKYGCNKGAQNFSEDMVVIEEPKMFYFDFDWTTDVEKK